MAYLDNFATIEEIEKFAYKDDNIKEQLIENKTMVYYNEDNEIQETNINIENTNIMSI
jgi:hypothetical protein